MDSSRPAQARRGAGYAAAVIGGLAGLGGGVLLGWIAGWAWPSSYVGGSLPTPVLGSAIGAVVGPPVGVGARLRVSGYGQAIRTGVLTLVVELISLAIFRLILGIPELQLVGVPALVLYFASPVVARRMARARPEQR